jgi:hypothetical protein
MSSIRLLLDEHYPPALARSLRELGIDAVAILDGQRRLIGAPDPDVLSAAVKDGRVVVTEDVSTFPIAASLVPAHLGIIYCRSRVFRRTPEGIPRLVSALHQLAADPPAGLGVEPIVWWLSPPVTMWPG